MIRSQPFDCKASVRYLRKVFPPLCCCGVQIYKMRCRFWSVYIYCMYLFPPPSFLHISLSLSASLIFSPLPLSLSLCQPPPTWTPRANERSTSNRHGNSMWMCSARGVGRSACRNCTRRLSWIYRVYCKVGESAAGCLPVCFGTTRDCVAGLSDPTARSSVWILCFRFLCMWVCIDVVWKYPPLPFPVCVSQCVYERLYLSFCSCEHPLVFPLLSLSLLSVSESHFSLRSIWFGLLNSIAFCRHFFSHWMVTSFLMSPDAVRLCDWKGSHLSFFVLNIIMYLWCGEAILVEAEYQIDWAAVAQTTLSGWSVFMNVCFCAMWINSNLPLHMPVCYLEM